jgi:hypothetical protein
MLSGMESNCALPWVRFGLSSILSFGCANPNLWRATESEDARRMDFDRRSWRLPRRDPAIERKLDVRRSMIDELIRPQINSNALQRWPCSVLYGGLIPNGNKCKLYVHNAWTILQGSRAMVLVCACTPASAACNSCRALQRANAIELG